MEVAFPLSNHLLDLDDPFMITQDWVNSNLLEDVQKPLIPVFKELWSYEVNFNTEQIHLLLDFTHKHSVGDFGGFFTDYKDVEIAEGVCSLL